MTESARDADGEQHGRWLMLAMLAVLAALVASWLVFLLAR